MIEQTYRIDMIPDGAPVVVHVSQYDTAARRLSFELYNGGVAYELPAGAVASIAGTKPDNTPFLYAMTVSGNLVSIDLQQQMALVAGDVPAEIQITGAEGKIGSANFIIRVERGPIDENSVISETDLPIFEQLVSDAQAAANEAQTAAEDAADAAESVGSIVPASTGTAGQVLTKTANGADWADKYPSGGTTGQVLTKTANGEAWDDVDGLPSGGTAGQVLTKNSSTSGDASWQTPQSGGGGTWGSITGTLSDQTDLNNALNAKANASNLATIESSTTASQAYSAGDYLVLNGQLYEVTAAISSGETLTVGTNISATTVGSELTALNNSSTWKLVGSATGTNNLDISQVFASAKEFLIIVAIDGGGNKESIVVPSAEVAGNSWYRAGGYTTISTPVLVTVFVSATAVRIISASLQTTDYTNTSVLRVYYR